MVVPIDPPDAILLGAVSATCGWLHTSRCQRRLCRKQHTIKALTQANFDKDFRDCLDRIGVFFKAGGILVDGPSCSHIIGPYRTVMNHFEFIAAGLRNGDFDEKLIKDSWRGTIITLFEKTKDYIDGRRILKSTNSIYEHIEWLCLRWGVNEPNKLQKCIEYIIDRPLRFPMKK